MLQHKLFAELFLPKFLAHVLTSYPTCAQGIEEDGSCIECDNVRLARHDMSRSVTAG